MSSLAAALGLAAAWLQAAQPPSWPTRHFQQAEVSSSALPPADGERQELALGNAARPDEPAAWQTVPLPDLHARSAAGAPVSAALGVMRWYRLRYSPSDAPDASADNKPQLGLYIPRVVSGPISVLMRDVQEADGAAAAWRVLYQSNDRWDEEWNRPLLFELPAGAGPHVEIVIGCSGYVDRRLLVMSTLWVGPYDALRTRAAWRSLLQLQAPMATSTAVFIVGLFALGVWWRRRHEQAYLYFAAASAVWCFRNLHYTLDLPEDPALLDAFWWATNASLSWAMLLVYRFALRFDGRRHRGLERALLVIVLLMTLVSLPGLPGVPRELDLLLIQHIVNGIVALGVSCYMTVLCWRGGGPELRAITLASWLCQAFGVNDLLLVSGRMDPETIYLLPYAPLVVLGSFLYATLLRYVQAIQQVEGANERLAASLREREAELEANHARLRSIEKEQTLLLERQRLMADMHDGIGSTLMSSLLMLEHGEIDRAGVAALLRECVDDLRLVIDSLEPVENDLGMLLATLRHRLGRRLESAGVRLEWVMEDLPRLPWLSPPDALQVLRLVQEVLTNVLKHAGATRVRMSVTATTDGHIALSIRDDGCGFDSVGATVQGGRGLNNLRLRARHLKAQLDVQSAPGKGTEVRLLLPVQRV